MHDSRPLVSVRLDALHPTQMTVGAAEVVAKRAEWAALKPQQRRKVHEAHWFPAVKGPGGRYFIVDHHHLGVALHEEGVDQAWIMALEDFSGMEADMFWRLMEFNRWAHPYDRKGRRRDYADIPGAVAGLRDDPYRSLAGFVRRAGGYAKDAAPYAEFLWAEFFRMQPALASLARNRDGQVPDATLHAALALAHSPAALHLPGAAAATPPPVPKR